MRAWMMACVMSVAAFAVQAQTMPKIIRLADDAAQSFMWVGNSFFYYNNGVPLFLQRLMAGAPPTDFRPYRATMVTIGGSGLDWHDMESYFRPQGVGYYAFDADNNIVFDTRNKLYDAVIMMDCGQCPIHPTLSKLFTQYAATDSAIVRKHNAEPILFMSWAYADKPEMTALLAEAYTVAGNANNALVIPAGLAFARVRHDHPEIELYQRDNRHPTQAGSYLAAATSYAALYHRSPEENSYNAGLDPEIAHALRVAAWQTVQAYFGETHTQ